MDDRWEADADGTPLRTLLSVRLIDVAPVTDPAYRDTTAGIRSLADRLGLPLDEVRAVAESDGIVSLLTGETRRKPDQSSADRIALLRRRLSLM